MHVHIATGDQWQLETTTFLAKSGKLLLLAAVGLWNGKAGETWVNAQERVDAMLQPLSDQAVAAAAVQSGERVIDIGCGCGATSIALAERGAQVWGVDISAPMLARARERTGGLRSDITGRHSRHGFLGKCQHHGRLEDQLCHGSRPPHARVVQRDPRSVQDAVSIHPGNRRTDHVPTGDFRHPS